MKYLNLLFICMSLLTSCEKEGSSPDRRECKEVDYDTHFEIKLNEKACFSNDYTITIDNIKHQFCPCEVLCDFEGGLLISITTTTETTSEKKEILSYFLEKDGNIFNNYKISSLSYKYGSNEEVIPPCKEDFDPEKVVLGFTISKL